MKNKREKIESILEINKGKTGLALAIEVYDSAIRDAAKSQRKRRALADLFMAIGIMSKYGMPIPLEHTQPQDKELGILYISGVNPKDFTKKDIERLEDLGFFVSSALADCGFLSYKYADYDRFERR